MVIRRASHVDPTKLGKDVKDQLIVIQSKYGDNEIVAGLTAYEPHI